MDFAKNQFGPHGLIIAKPDGYGIDIPSQIILKSIEILFLDIVLIDFQYLLLLKIIVFQHWTRVPGIAYTKYYAQKDDDYSLKRLKWEQF